MTWAISPQPMTPIRSGAPVGTATPDAHARLLLGPSALSRASRLGPVLICRAD